MKAIISIKKIGIADYANTQVDEIAQKIIDRFSNIESVTAAQASASMTHQIDFVMKDFNIKSPEFIPFIQCTYSVNRGANRVQRMEVVLQTERFNIIKFMNSDESGKVQFLFTRENEYRIYCQTLEVNGDFQLLVLDDE